MQDKNKENDLIENGKAVEISWRKVFSWVALCLSTIVPIASIGAAITSLSLEIEDDKDESKIICFIAIGVSTFMLLNEFILKIITI